jgi:tetratricopeptide (TPR) repeat protein
MERERGGGSGWGFDGSTLAALRLERARAALQADDPERALVEAEELLDTEPAHEEALLLAGRSLLWIGDAHAAAAAFERLVAQQPALLEAWSRLSWARLHAADPPGATQAAGQALSLPGGAPRDRARAHFVRGLLAAREGLASAASDLRQAEELAPDEFPSPRPVSAEVWKVACAGALRRLPPQATAFLEGVPLRVEAHPLLEELRSTSPAASLLARAVALGAPPEDEDEPLWKPEEIVLYTENMAWPPPGRDELRERIIQALAELAEDWSGQDPEADPAG